GTDVFGVTHSTGFDLSGTVHTNAGSYAGDAWSFDAGSNYNTASGTVDDSIGKADAHAVVTPIAGLVYNGTPQTTAQGSWTDVFGVTHSTGFDLSGTVHTNAGSYAG